VTAPFDSEQLIDPVSVDDHAFAELAAFRAGRSHARMHIEGDSDRRKRLRIALVISLILHGLLYLGIRQWTKLHWDTSAETQVIHLRLIAPEPDSPLPIAVQPLPAAPDPGPVMPTPSELSVDRPVPRIPDRPQLPVPAQPSVSPLASDAITPTLSDATIATGIFDKHGNVILPAAPDDDPAVFGSRKRTPEYSPNPMAHASPLPYKKTPFDKYWKPDGETLLGEWVRKASKETTYDTIHGTRITCKAFLFLMACGWGPTPRVTIEELKAMRETPPAPRNSADDPYLPPVP
jgi:hypothetical protein